VKKKRVNRGQFKGCGERSEGRDKNMSEAWRCRKD